MGENYRIYGFGVKGKISILFDRFFSFPLIQSAVQKQTRTIDFHQMHRASYRLGRPVKTEFHCCLRDTVVLSLFILIHYHSNFNERFLKTPKLSFL